MNQEPLFRECSSFVSTLKGYVECGRVCEKREELLADINKIRIGSRALVDSGTFDTQKAAHSLIASFCGYLFELEAILEKEGDESELCKSLEKLRL